MALEVPKMKCMKQTRKSTQIAAVKSRSLAETIWGSVKFYRMMSHKHVLKHSTQGLNRLANYKNNKWNQVMTGQERKTKILVLTFNLTMIWQLLNQHLILSKLDYIIYTTTIQKFS